MPIRLLIADDNEIVRARVVEILGGHEGWLVDAAVGNGQEAVQKANELKPDVIVLDLAMPVMDGLSATREILRTLPTVPIIIYTLHNIPAIELEAKKAGARTMVMKPRIELLISAIEEIVANEFQNSGSNAAPGETSPASEVNPIAAATTDAGDTKTVMAEGDPTAPPAMGEPEPSA